MAIPHFYISPHISGHVFPKIGGTSPVHHGGTSCLERRQGTGWGANGQGPGLGGVWGFLGECLTDESPRGLWGFVWWITCVFVCFGQVSRVSNGFTTWGFLPRGNASVRMSISWSIFGVMNNFWLLNMLNTSRKLVLLETIRWFQVGLDLKMLG